MSKINDSCIVCGVPTKMVLCDNCRENASLGKCEHTNRTSKTGLIEDYDKCTDCGLEIPHNFPHQWNF